MNRVRLFLLLMGFASLAACRDGGTEPHESIAGTYRATSMIFTTPWGESLDVLAAGGSLEVVLTPQGTTTGTLVVPAGFTRHGTADDVIDLQGAYTRTATTVRFQQQGDDFIFVPGKVWLIGPGALTASNIRSTERTARIDVTLTRF